MKTTLICLKVSGVQGGDGKPRVCIWWYLPGGDPFSPDGGVCCDDLMEALRHVGLAIEEDQADQPDIPIPVEPEPNPRAVFVTAPGAPKVGTP